MYIRKPTTNNLINIQSANNMSHDFTRLMIMGQWSMSKYQNHPIFHLGQTAKLLLAETLIVTVKGLYQF